MATVDNEYGEPNARDASFTRGETAVVLWAMGASTKWERTFFEFISESGEVTRSEVHLLFPNLVDAYTEFCDGDLRERWADSHSEAAAAMRVAANGGAS